MNFPDLKPLLDQLIADTPAENQHALQCQVILTNGAMMSGALFRNSWDMEDIYCLRCVMRKGDPRTGEPEMVDCYFSSKAVFTVTVPTPKDAMPRIVGANGGVLHMD